MKEQIFYGQLNHPNRLFIQEKAKTKKDGAYSARWIGYRVRNGQVTHYARGREILANYGAFVTTVGTFENSDAAMKALKTSTLL
jgi:hypothetical protein